MTDEENEPIFDANGDDVASAIPTGDASAALTDAATELSPEQVAFAKALAEQAVAAATSERAAAEEVGEEDPDEGEPFPAAPPANGEFLAPASQIGIWEHHPRRDSRRTSDHGSALALSAAEPLALRPILVIRNGDGTYAVIDGRFRLEAIRAEHRGNKDVEVRCVLFDGTEAEAVAHVCDESLGTIRMSQIEQARALFSLKQTSNVSQTEIGNRYGLTISKVNNMLRAARVWHHWPELFDILKDPDRVSVDYGVKFFTLMKRLDGEEQQDLLDRARDLTDNHERFTPKDALKALRVDGEADTSDATTAKPANEQPALEIEDVFGADDQPLGKAEQLAGDRLLLTLPPISEIVAMSASEREENAAPFIARIRQHFGLDEGG